MAYKFSDDDKQVKEFSEKIPFGVSKVQLVGAVAGETEAGKDFIELTVTNADGVEDTARVWFVGGAANISFNTLRQIAVHNGKTEKQKQELRDAMDNCETTDDMATLFMEKLIGGELWFTRYYDPKRTYEGQDGNTYRSVNKNVYGYEPREKTELMPNKESADDRDERKQAQGEKSGDEALNIPDEWS